MEGGRILHKFLRQISLYLLITIILVMVIQGMYQSVEPVQQLTYSQLNALIRNNQVRTAVLIGDQSIQGTLRDGTKFESMVPVGKMAEVSDLLIEQNVDIEAQAPRYFLVGCLTAQYYYLNYFCRYLAVYSQSDAGRQ